MLALSKLPYEYMYLEELSSTIKVGIFINLIKIIRIPLLSIPVSDWFRAAHITYHNFTVRP